MISKYQLANLEVDSQLWTGWYKTDRILQRGEIIIVIQAYVDSPSGSPGYEYMLSKWCWCEILTHSGEVGLIYLGEKEIIK